MDLQLSSLRARYSDGTLLPRELFREVHRRTEGSAEGTWILRLGLDAVLSAVERAEARRSAGEHLPLFGVPFAVKDNVDVQGLPTTAACPDFSYLADRSATVVQKLEHAGAILIGKTNLDQFATGLVGVRSPYGACQNPFDSRFIAGGSSSGSAVAVSTGLVSFALGTDTAGSGRVPAALCNVVGFKPSLGRVSTSGVVPACRTLDCVSVFAGSAKDCGTVLGIIEGLDMGDALSRSFGDDAANAFGSPLRVGVPTAEQLEWFGDTDAEGLYRSAVEKTASMGAVIRPTDLAPFKAVATLLYEGPWVAQRLEATADLLARGGAVHPVVRGILERARSLTALDAYRGEIRLRELRRETDRELDEVDVLLLPTTPTTYTRDQIEADPVRLNSRLGTYTNFVNLLDLAAVAVPAGFRRDGLPLGVTFIARAGRDRALLELGARFHAMSSSAVGNTGVPVI